MKVKKHNHFVEIIFDRGRVVVEDTASIGVFPFDESEDSGRTPIMLFNTGLADEKDEKEEKEDE